MTPQTFGQLADFLPEPMLLVEPSGRVLAANEAMRQLLGKGFLPDRSYHISELFAAPREEIEDYLRLCSGVRQFLPGALKLQFYSGQPTDLVCEGASVGQIISRESCIVLRFKPRVVAMKRFQWLNTQIEQLNHEVGERIKVEAERKKAEERLEESLLREKEARRSAEAANRSKDDFLASLSHELRTPLNPALLVASESADNLDLPPEIRADFEIIRKHIELEARLIDDLLDLTRLNHGKLFMNPRLIEAQTVLQDSIEIIRPDTQEKNIQLSVSTQPIPVPVFCDEVRLQQIFWNVLKNAVKFTPQGGTITIVTSMEGDWLKISITDNGIGMTPPEIERLFAAFSQGDHADKQPRNYGGLGLGLAISHRLVSMQSGRIYATSPGRNKGATFTIELPLAKTENANLPSSNTVAAISPMQGRGNSVLLLEDHEPTRNALSHLLTRRKYIVVPAGTLAEARSLLTRHKIHFVISDIGLPDGNGNDLMKELRRDFGLKGIALTGYGMDKDIEESRSSGFVAHLIKPITIRSLEKALETVANF